TVFAFLIEGARFSVMEKYVVRLQRNCFFQIANGMIERNVAGDSAEQRIARESLNPVEAGKFVMPFTENIIGGKVGGVHLKQRLRLVADNLCVLQFLAWTRCCF